MKKVFSKTAHHAFAFAIALIFLASACVPLSAQTARRRSRATANPRYLVPADTLIRVRLNERLKSGDVREGDRFTTTVVDPVYAKGVEVIPAGSTVDGHVSAVKGATRKSEAGNFTVTFTSIKTPQGNSYPISGSLTDLDEANVNADNESTVKGRSSKKRNIAYIGGGAVVGALINGVAGAAIGAGLGTAGAIVSKGKEAEIKAGTEFGVVLNRSAYMYASR